MADRLIVDCSSGDRRTEPLTTEEEADLAALAQAAADREAEARAADQAWRDALRNASTLADLKAVLAGDTGDGQADRRPV